MLEREQIINVTDSIKEFLPFIVTVNIVLQSQAVVITIPQDYYTVLTLEVIAKMFEYRKPAGWVLETKIKEPIINYI